MPSNMPANRRQRCSEGRHYRCNLSDQECDLIAVVAAGCEDDAVARSEARRQLAGMTDAVARALSSLPALGENRSGPLGPGRLGLGHVGETIREIQALLTER
jgi:hypothetical protein